ncbi:MAG: glycosyltransferase family A protein [Salinisphaera sp.]|jgi:glycosyltransferase involved in cell wall biosynthesis|nr:glycosyltransferase family A protein [Salinisphaera sp.]
MIDITVLIPVYNRARYIVSAIQSIQNQKDAPPLEILIVDDGSTDDSMAHIRALADPRIRVVAREQNGGIAAARNLGITQARGRYIAFLDSDDHALPDRLRLQARFLDKHPDYAALGSWIGWITADGQPMRRIKRKPIGARLIAAERLFRSGLENSTVMARADILRAFPHREDLAVGSDYDLWARVAADYPLTCLPRRLVDRRNHATQATAEHVENDKRYRSQVFAWQLEALGIDFSPADLDRHYRLRRLNKTGEIVDSAFLDWADQWLGTLRQANNQHLLYPEPEFSGVLALFWASACWHGRRATGSWRQFLRSPLARRAPLGAYQAANQRLNVWAHVGR